MVKLNADQKFKYHVSIKYTRAGTSIPKTMWLSRDQVEMAKTPEFFDIVRQLFYIKQEGSMRIFPDQLTVEGIVDIPAPCEYFN